MCLLYNPVYFLFYISFYVACAFVICLLKYLLTYFHATRLPILYRMIPFLTEGFHNPSWLPGKTPLRNDHSSVGTLSSAQLLNFSRVQSSIKLFIYLKLSVHICKTCKHGITTDTNIHESNTPRPNGTNRRWSVKNKQESDTVSGLFFNSNCYLGNWAAFFLQKCCQPEDARNSVGNHNIVRLTS